MRPLTPSDPRRIGYHDVLAVLGDGSMGRVYLGRGPSGRLVAIKLISSGLADDQGFRDRFAAEVAAMRRVGGAVSVPVVEADAEAPQPWLATAFVAGPDLRSAVEKSGPLPPAALITLTAGLAEALHAFHRAGLVHRDLKPANILLDRGGPRVIDFGLARPVDATAATLPAALEGTASFMAPEQAAGGAPTPAGDVFALGAVVAYAATGRPPFGADTVPAVLHRVITQPPDLAGVPPELHGLLAACLDKEPDRRPAPGRILEALPATAPGTAPWPPPDVLDTIAARERRARELLAGRRPARRRRALIAGTAAVTTLVLIAGGIAAVRSGALPLGPPAAPGDPVAEGATPTAHPAPVAGAAFTPDLDPGELAGTLFVPARDAVVLPLGFDPADPARLYAGGPGGTDEWNLETGERMPGARSGTSDVSALAYSRDGAVAAAGTNGGWIYVSDRATAETLWEYGPEGADRAPLSLAEETPPAGP
ncbi:protein kinase domain-containing protein [Marinactinospora rubrisoli]|uniref:Protein kinase n=1 Tax=Marinactinospora rubrisoli TaxID=2715399 RepID=A0ABW2KDF7_9ACTN